MTLKLLSAHSRYERQGIGSALIKAAEDWAKNNGICAMRLNSGGNNRKISCDFYIDNRALAGNAYKLF